MASDKKYLEFIIGQLSELEDIDYRAMMGEYIIYYKGKVAGGIYDNKFLIKNVKSVKNVMNDIIYEIPYSGAKEMILVSEVEDKMFLKRLFEEIYEELPELKKKKKKNYSNPI